MQLGFSAINPNLHFRDKWNLYFELHIRIEIFATIAIRILNYKYELRFSQQMQLGFLDVNPNWDFRDKCNLYFELYIRINFNSDFGSLEFLDSETPISVAEIRLVFYI